MCQERSILGSVSGVGNHSKLPDMSESGGVGRSWRDILSRYMKCEGCNGVKYDKEMGVRNSRGRFC